MKDILILGSTSQLGKELYDLLISNKNHNITTVNSKDLNFLEIKKIDFFFERKQFDIIINCSAFTNVDLAETENKKAMQINANILKNINRNLSVDTIFIYISSDYVFDGLKNLPYLENEKRNPINYYGLTKMVGEDIIKNEFNNSIIIRTAALYSNTDNNFVAKIINKAKNEKELNIIEDQYTSTTSAYDLASFIAHIIESNKIYNINKKNNIFHFVNNGIITWFDFAKEIFSASNIKVTLNRISFNDYKFIAKRPKFSALNNNKVKNVFDYDINHYSNSLINCLKRNYK